MAKNKLEKFKENESFKCLFQPTTDEVLRKDYKLKGKWGSEVFGNDNPIVLELGCGKGEYTIDLAERNPSVNYIGIDIKGARLWKGAKYATEHDLKNVIFIRTRIEFIESFFAQDEISEIWLTFSDPQIRREKNRLTNPLFITRYSNFLKKAGIIHQKTDSRYLYEYTKAMAEQNNLEILAYATDLYGEDHDKLYHSTLESVCGRDAIDALFEVQTFYESQYLAQDIKITYLAFTLESQQAFQEPLQDNAQRISSVKPQKRNLSHKQKFISPEWDEDRWKDERHRFVIQSGLSVESKFYPSDE